MDVAIWIELLKGIGVFFVHPLFYLGIFIMIFIGIRRVRRERKDFHVRVYDFVEEFVSSIKPGLFAGMALSVLMMGLGIVLSPVSLIIIAGAYLLLTLTFQVRWLAPAYVFPLSLVIIYVLSKYTISIPLFGDLSIETGTHLLFNLAAFFTLLLLAEGILIRVFGYRNTSPRLLPSGRGKYVGGHEARRMWAVPILVPIPNGIIPSFYEWPFFSLATEETFSIVLLPFFVGFSQLIKSATPKEAIKQIGGQVVGIGLIMLLFVGIGYFIPVLLIIGAIVTLILREGLWFGIRLRENSKISYFTLQKEGIVILGILPNSPAEKMKLEIGERIMKVNGEPVNKPSEFYTALQKKSAFCKLEVMDEKGEIRLAQTALYDGEHHQMGVLFVKEDYLLQDSII